MKTVNPAEIARYTQIPFPAYRYIPFQGMPHPRNDPDGHSYNQEEDYLADFDSNDWATCTPYLYGFDLFNYGYWWEAHEAWEAVWLAAGRKTETGIFVQGLIQIAAGQLKRFMDEERGAELLTSDGATKLETFTGIFMGIDAADLAARARATLECDQDTVLTIRLSLPSKP